MNSVLLVCLTLLVLQSAVATGRLGLSPRIIADLESSLGDPFPVPQLCSDANGHVHLFNACLLNPEPSARDGSNVWAMHYARYLGPTLDSAVDFRKPMRKGVDYGSRMYVSDSGIAFCLFGPTECRHQSIVFAQSGEPSAGECIQGVLRDQTASPRRDGSLLYLSCTPKGLVAIIDTEGTVAYAGNAERFQNAIRDLPYFLVIDAISASAVDNDNIIYVLGRAQTKDRKPERPDGRLPISVVAYDLGRDKLISSRLYHLDRDSTVMRTELECDERIRAFSRADGQIGIFAPYLGSDGVRKLCYFVLGRDLKLAQQSSRVATEAPKDLSPLDPKVEHQFYWIERSPDPHYVGWVWQIALTADTLYWWRSEPIRSRAYEQYEK